MSDFIERNIISGNTGFGIIIEGGALDVTVAGNYIGTDITGSLALGNLRGINLGKWDGSTTCSSVLIGTNGDGVNDELEGNVISGNVTGISISGASNNTIAGNYIGTKSDGKGDLGNTGDGIAFIYNGGSQNTIGGDVLGEANVIAYNGDGAGEYGVKLKNATSDGNKILRNVFFENENQGIYLPGDGSNNDITAPAILSQSASQGLLYVEGTAGSYETIQLFAADLDGEEGEVFIGQTDADVLGNWQISALTENAVGTYYVATATDDVDGTSEFSDDYIVLNEAPVSLAQTVKLNEDNSVTVNLSALDPNTDALNYIIVSEPKKGSLSQLTQSTGSVVYTPQSDFTGTDSFTFKVNDGQLQSNESTVLLNIVSQNDTPAANDVNVITNRNTVVFITLTATDVDGNDLTYKIVDLPEYGTISGFNKSTGKFYYMPDDNFVGTDLLTYKVYDGYKFSAKKTVTIEVVKSSSNNIKPVVSLGADRQVSVGRTLQIKAVASDADDDELSYEWTQTKGNVVNIINAKTDHMRVVISSDMADSILEFMITVSDGIDEVYDTVKVTVLKNKIVLDNAVTIKNKVVGTDGVNQSITSALVEYKGEMVNEIKFWNSCKLYSSTENDVKIEIVSQHKLIVADPYWNYEKGKVVLLDRTKINCSGNIDLNDESIVNRSGIMVVTGIRSGELFGYNVKTADMNDDGELEIYVAAPGSHYGYVYGFDIHYLNTERIFVGSQSKQLTTALMVFGDLNDEEGADVLFGVSVDDLVNMSVSDLGASSFVVPEAFVGFSAGDDFPENIDLLVDDVDFYIESAAPISHLTKSDLNADGLEDVIMGSEEDCDIQINYGASDFGEQTSEDLQAVITCDVNEGFSAIVTEYDVTGDGYDDLIVGSPEADNDNGIIYVLLGPIEASNTTYTLEDAVVIQGKNKEGIGEKIVVADYDGDGINDIYTNSYFQGEQYTKIVLLGKSLGVNSTNASGSYGIGGGYGCNITYQNNKQYLKLNIQPVILLFLYLSLLLSMSLRKEKDLHS